LLTILYTAKFKMSIENFKFADLKIGGENMAVDKVTRTTLTAIKNVRGRKKTRINAGVLKKG